MKRPSFASTSADELATVIDGSYFEGGKPAPGLAYSQAKYIGTLWMASLAREYPSTQAYHREPREYLRLPGTPSDHQAAAKYRGQIRHAAWGSRTAS